MIRCTFLVVCLAGMPTFAQDPLKVVALKVKAADRPTPLVRHPLMTPRSEQTKGNAALLIHRALHLWRESRGSPKDHADWLGKITPALDDPGSAFPVDVARLRLSQFRKALEELEAAAQCDHCDWGIEERVRREFRDFLFVEISLLRDLATVLRIRCRTQIVEGKLDGALRDVRIGLTLARQTAAAPTMIHFLVAVAIANLFLSELELVIQQPGSVNLYWPLAALPRPFLDYRQGAKAEVNNIEALLSVPELKDNEAMTAEGARTAILTLWNRLIDVEVGAGESKRRMSPLLVAFLTAMQEPTDRKLLREAGLAGAVVDAMPAAQAVILAQRLRFRDLRDQYLAALEAPYPEVAQAFRSLEDRPDEARRGAGPLQSLGSNLELYLPHLSFLADAQVQIDRRIAALRTVEAIRMYAARNAGNLPKTLADLPVPTPSDPMISQPFVYRVAGDRCFIDLAPPTGQLPRHGWHWTYAVTLVK